VDFLRKKRLVAGGITWTTARRIYRNSERLVAQASSFVKRVARLAGWKPAPLGAKDFRNRNRNLSGATFRRRLQLLLVFIK
jgi:hypothetical protein